MRIAVVGRGMIGSAAAKYLARAGHDVVLIGPEEPADKRAHQGVFASHYDEGRITRALDADRFWSRVSRASIARYRDIEAESGTPFFGEVGAMIAGPADGFLMRSVTEVQESDGIAADRLEGTALADRFPFFSFDDEVLAYYEPRGAGYLSPRRMVQAQTVLAQRSGARVIACEVHEIRANGAVRTAEGEERADRVLVAAGGFTNTLINPPLPIRVLARTVAFYEVDEVEVARLHGMPSLVYQAADGRDPYLLPPIRYPDGKTYLKLGGDRQDLLLEGRQAIGDWFRSGGSGEVAEDLTAQIRARMPGLRYVAMHSEACVTTFAQADRPVIRHLDDRRAVAVAGCGRGAKCSDELGRMAADLYADAG